MATGQASNVLTQKILAWLLAKREPVAQRDPITGRFLLPYSRSYQWMMLAMFVLATGFLVLGIAGTLDDTKALLIVSLIFGLLWLATAAALYDVTLVTIDVADDGIRRTGPIASEIHLSWQEIETMGYSDAWKWFYFRVPGKGTIRVSVYRSGLETLAATAAARLQGRPVEANVTVLRERTARPF